MTQRPLTVLLVALLVLTGACAGSSTPAAQQGRRARTPTTSVSTPPAPHPLRGHRHGRNPWRTSGYTPHHVKHPPYVDQRLLEGVLPAKVDKDGVFLYTRHGKHYYHPVAIIHYALAKLDVARRTHSRGALHAAKVNADKLLDIATSRHGALFFPYPFDFALGGKRRHTIRAPWWSGMAQGQALSLFVRLYRETGKRSWRTAADKTFASMDETGPRKAPWAALVDQRHYLWFEEYAGNTKPMLVLNGDMFATFGVFDYYRMTHSAKARRLFDAAVTTLREYLPLYRHPGGGVSYYCLRAPFCQRRLWQNAKYHGIVIDQMHLVADMTRDHWFDREARRFAGDHTG